VKTHSSLRASVLVSILAAAAAPAVFAQEPSQDTTYTPPPEVARFWNGQDEAGEGDGAAPESDGDDSPREPLLLAEGRMTAALFDDFQFGGRVGVETGARLPLGFFIDFEGRPFGKAVRVRESETLEYQFREHRFTLGPGASLNVPARGGTWWTFAGGVGLSFGTYRGSARAAETTVPVWFETGWRAKIGGSQHLGIAYQYFPLPGASPHRIAVQWGARLGAKIPRPESP